MLKWILKDLLKKGVIYNDVCCVSVSRYEFNHIVFHDEGFWEDTHTQEMSESHKKICNK